jgi:hypothetical protein
MQLARRGRQRQRAREVRYGLGIMGMLLIIKMCREVGPVIIYTITVSSE